MRRRYFILTRCRVSFACFTLLALCLEYERTSDITIAEPVRVVTTKGDHE